MVALIALVASGCGFGTKAVERGAPDSSATATDDTSTTAPQDSSPGGTATNGAAPATVPPAPGGFQARLTTWKSCHGRYQCATLTVPLDWGRPDGEKIDLAVIRLQHDGGEPRIGSVVFNPGGPGGSGIDFLRQSLPTEISKPLRQRFDLVSWDPRGTGESRGIVCSTDAELAAPDLDPDPNTLAEVAATEAQDQHHRDECVQKVGPGLLAEVGTRNTVRDLDALRYALDERGLTYVGFSYGSTIGVEYAAMFPTHIRAMVLDGIAIPGEDTVASSYDQGVAFEKALGEFFDNCRKKGCAFGGDDPKAALVALQARLHAGLRLPASYDYTAGLQRTATLGIGELDLALVQAMYDKSLWPVLEQGLAKALDPTNPDGGDLLLLRDLYIGRQEDGTWKSMLDANGAINCADSPDRSATAVGDPAIRSRFDQELPILGPFIAAGQPGCHLQPPPLEPLTLPADGSITDTPPVVIVSNTGDPATPYKDGLDLTRIITHSVLITGETTQHTAYGRGAGCLDDPVTTYLIDLKVPKAGIRCTVP